MRSIATLLLTFQCVAGCTDRSATTSTTAVPEAARPRTGITIRVVDLLNVDIRDVPLLMAFDELAAHGYLIEKAYLGSGALVTDTLARGDADVAIVNNQTAWTALTKGADIRTIAEFTSPTYVLAVSPTIQSCHDLGGRKVGVPTTSGLPGMFLPLYMHRHCPGTTPQMLIILESSARNAALMSGVVDAVIVPAEGLIKVQRQSSAAFHALMSFASEFPGVQMDGLHVRRDWAEQHRELVLDLLRAQLRAQRLVTDSPDVLYQ
ncbi:MAG: ABC transporter substrate-binding protein, partial [Vicinamibacterales bacterium]